MSNIIKVIDIGGPRRYFEEKCWKIKYDMLMNGWTEEDFQKAYSVFKTVVICGGVMSIPITAQAGTQEVIIKACKPIFDLLKGVGYPVVVCIEMAGAIRMSFDRRGGIKMMKDGAIGYIVLQFVPTLLKILAGIGTDMELTIP